MKKLITRMITFVMVAVMVINSTSISALADTGINSMSKSTVNVQNFDPSMVATIENIVQDKETAETIMQELYKTGLVDATGKPVANRFFDVDGKTMSMDELRAAADAHVLDESAAVSIDGYEVTWGYVRSLLAIRTFLFKHNFLHFMSLSKRQLIAHMATHYVRIFIIISLFPKTRK